MFHECGFTKPTVKAKPPTNKNQHQTKTNLTNQSGFDRLRTQLEIGLSYWSEWGRWCGLQVAGRSQQKLYNQKIHMMQWWWKNWSDAAQILCTSSDSQERFHLWVRFFSRRMRAQGVEHRTMINLNQIYCSGNFQEKCTCPQDEKRPSNHFEYFSDGESHSECPAETDWCILAGEVEVWLLAVGRGMKWHSPGRKENEEVGRLAEGLRVIIMILGSRALTNSMAIL